MQQKRVGNGLSVYGLPFHTLTLGYIEPQKKKWMVPSIPAFGYRWPEKREGEGLSGLGLPFKTLALGYIGPKAGEKRRGAKCGGAYLHDKR